MRIETRLFGTVEVGEEKIITFPGGIIGFSYMKQEPSKVLLQVKK